MITLLRAPSGPPARVCPRSHSGQWWMPVSGRSWPRGERPECPGLAVLPQKPAKVRPASPPQLKVIMLTTSMPGARPPNQLEFLGKTEGEEVERGPLGGVLWSKTLQTHTVPLILNNGYQTLNFRFNNFWDLPLWFQGYQTQKGY